MAKRYYQTDANSDAIRDKTVAVIGYGSQGHAHALNLRDSGVDVVVGLYKGSKSWAKAEAAGLRVMTVAEAAKTADIIMMLVSDHLQADLYNSEIAPSMTTGKTLMFAHGFAIHFGTIVPPKEIDVTRSGTVAVSLEKKKLRLAPPVPRGTAESREDHALA